MSLTVVAQETALRALARIRSEDKEAFTAIRRALADQPRPEQAVAWGGAVAGAGTGVVRDKSKEAGAAWAPSSGVGCFTGR